MAVNKKMLICISVTFLFVSLTLAGCISEYTKEERVAIIFLSFSSDGTKLISITEEYRLKQNDFHTFASEFQIWNISSGEIIESEYPSHSDWAYFSPDDKYFIKGESKKWSIYNSNSGELVSNISGFYQDWSDNNKFIVTTDCKFLHSECNLTIWEVENFTGIKTISIPKSTHPVRFSYDGTKLVFYSENANSISMIDISNENFTYIWNASISPKYSYLDTFNLIWSNDGKRMGTFGSYVENNTGYFDLLTWNVTNGNLTQEIITNCYPYGHLRIIAPTCEKYMYYDRENSTLNIFNISGLENTIQFDSGNPTALAWSYYGNIIAIGNRSGIIEIRNASTGELINTLETPIREVVYQVPGFELILVACTIALVLLWKGKRKVF